MRKLLTSLVLAVFASGFAAVGAEVQAKTCLKAPKNYLPCPASKTHATTATGN